MYRHLLNDHSRLNHIKTREGIKIARASSISAWKEVNEIRKILKSEFERIEDDFNKRYTPRKVTVEQWFEDLCTLSTVKFKKLKEDMDRGADIEYILLKNIRFKPIKPPIR